MINDFNSDIMSVYNEALKYTTFEAIAKIFIDDVKSNENYSLAKKLALGNSVSYIKNYPDSNIMTNDGALLGILKITWQEMGLPETELDALSELEREAIFDNIMAICKSVIQIERDRLNQLLSADVSLPADWNEPEPEPEAE